MSTTSVPGLRTSTTCCSGLLVQAKKVYPLIVQVKNVYHLIVQITTCYHPVVQEPPSNAAKLTLFQKTQSCPSHFFSQKSVVGAITGSNYLGKKASDEKLQKHDTRKNEHSKFHAWSNVWGLRFAKLHNVN